MEHISRCQEVRWPALRHRLAYDGAAYLSLAKDFRNLEWFEDADNCYYNYRRMCQAEKRLVCRERMRPTINWSKLLDEIAWISCGYGTRPRHTVFLRCLPIVLLALTAGIFRYFATVESILGCCFLPTSWQPWAEP
ncbi:MAG: hypothetical protein PHQ34_15080 [Methanothrix sp.]|nr:hypothetical protein [Methanothrix sp.]